MTEIQNSLNQLRHIFELSLKRAVDARLYQEAANTQIALGVLDQVSLYVNKDGKPELQTNPKHTTQKVLLDVAAERVRQDEKWGQLNHRILPDNPGTDTEIRERYLRKSAQEAQQLTDFLANTKRITHMDILIEEVWEAIEAKGTEHLRRELVQVAAVAVNMIESIDRNGK